MKTLKTVFSLLLAGLAGWLYRRGGTNAGTLWRDLGVPAVSTIVLVLMGFNLWWALLIHFVLLFASLTTYNKWAGKIFGRTDNNVHWESWAVTGFSYGFALLPVAWALGLWIPFLIRTAFLTLAVTLWCVLVGRDWLEEGGRGVLIVGSLGFLLI